VAFNLKNTRKDKKQDFTAKIQLKKKKEIDLHLNEMLGLNYEQSKITNYYV